jgi:hypothetical protein
MEAPISRTTRDRERERERDRFFRRTNPPQAISTAEANRDREFELQYGRPDRPRDPYTSSANRYADSHPDRAPPPIPAASPEVISSLITSLSVISRPVSQHFDGPLDFGSRSPNNLSVPASPTTARSGGSFGVDYGAFSQPSLDDLQEESLSLDELPASPPVIRTSKPPSGFSTLTAPKSPISPKGPGLKTLLGGNRSSSVNGSRPSSRGSLASVGESIGNLSVERGFGTPLSESKSPKRQRSHDSWGRNIGRSSKGLMYMSSKERLREKELDKKRASIGAVGGSSNGPLSPGISNIPERPDPFLAETAINEEPHGDSPPRRDSGQLDNPRAIPVRDSSLRKSGSTPKKSAARTSRSSKRDSDTVPSQTIHEIDEPSTPNGAQRGDSQRRRNHDSRPEVDSEQHPSATLDIPRRPKRDLSFSKPQPDRYFSNGARNGATSPMSPALDVDPLEDGAPSPAVAQGRRRDRELSSDGRNRRRSKTPDALSGYISDSGIGVKLKRSSSRLKRLSGAPSPTPDKVSSDQGNVNRNSQNTQSDQPHIAYERPRSADSIDDAVESYLCSPRLSQKIRHPQTGRVISFSEVGDPNGSAVFCCVGMGLTRYITAFYDELALTLKLRLITPDRPGVGDSEPYAEGTSTPLSWPGMLPSVRGYTVRLLIFCRR